LGWSGGPAALEVPHSHPGPRQQGFVAAAAQGCGTGGLLRMRAHLHVRVCVDACVCGCLHARASALVQSRCSCRRYSVKGPAPYAALWPLVRTCPALRVCHVSHVSPAPLARHLLGLKHPLPTGWAAHDRCHPLVWDGVPAPSGKVYRPQEAHATAACAQSAEQ